MILITGFLIITTFEGALRFYSAKAHAPWLIYSKDVMVMGALGIGVVITLLTNIRNLPFFFVLIAIVIGTIVGVGTLHDIRMPLFAAKTMLALLCGTSIGSAIDLQSRYFRYTCIGLLSATIGGVLLTTKWHAPWVGFEYEVAGVTVEGSREWSIQGVDRVAGFCRSSFEAGLVCVFLAILVVQGTRNYFVSLFIWIAAGGAIYLTTSRSAAAGLVAAMALHVLVSFNRWSQLLAKFGVLFFAILVAIIPFAAGKYYKHKAGETDSNTIVASTSSFQERATKTWPDAFALQKKGGNLLVGRGLGGIGAAQQYYEPSLFSPGDNFFLYLWVAFGMLGLLFLGFIPFLAWRAPIPLDQKRKAGMIVVAAFLAVGLTLNGIESAIASLLLGLGMAWLAYRPEYD